MVATLFLAVGLYATTNIDNFVVLAAFYTDRLYRPGQVTVGAFFGLAVVVAVSVGAAAAAATVPNRFVGLLGAVPLTLGVVRLVALGRGKPPPDPDTRAAAAHHGPLVVGAVTVGSGADNIAAYVPIFATRSLGESGLIVAVFVVATGLWCYAAHGIAHARWTAPVIGRVSRLVVPFVYLALGVSILVFSGTVGWLAGTG